jgi:hypothetical protein
MRNINRAKSFSRKKYLGRNSSGLDLEGGKYLKSWELASNAVSFHLADVLSDLKRLNKKPSRLKRL